MTWQDKMWNKISEETPESKGNLYTVHYEPSQMHKTNFSLKPEPTSMTSGFRDLILSR